MYNYMYSQGVLNKTQMIEIGLYLCVVKRVKNSDYEENSI